MGKFEQTSEPLMIASMWWRMAVQGLGLWVGGVVGHAVKRRLGCLLFERESPLASSWMVRIHHDPLPIVACCSMREETTKQREVNKSSLRLAP